MLRFATSPTGDMHIGDLRGALFNYIISKQRNEDLIIRIEDSNKEKNIKGKDEEILGLLNLFGIEYTQVIYQSESVRFHTAMALQLMHEKQAFSCFCSTEWLDKKREEAKLKGQEYKYDDACGNLPAELVIDNLSPFTIRIAKPTQDNATFKARDIDSFIIMGQDKTPTYNFSCAVDDMLNNISIVIRDEDDMNNTPKQIHIRNALKYEKQITYIHLPVILNNDAVRIKWLLEEGFLPEAISNYLISITNKTPKEIFTLSEATQWLSLENISKSPTRFDINMLRHVNNEHLRMLEVKELSRYVGFADDEIGELAKVYLEEVSTTKELKSKINAIFTLKVIPQEFTQSAEIISTIIKSAPYFENYTDFQKYIMEKSGFQKENISQPLRFVLTGAQNGPDIDKIYKYIKNYMGEIVK
ncbi:glutamate--tRNA ligase [Sulfurimonas sp. SAG-AH-194-I05]|nr:glutamate--tRNA ligase [Sulfurimonas sp. SAG-AH-194-I05]MDF1875831.1 glutamate--tRNA ligase [Sulfurimonas sp. SAG-AH-194-I05]